MIYHPNAAVSIIMLVERADLMMELFGSFCAGHSYTVVTPVRNGSVEHPEAIVHTEVAGALMTEQLGRYLLSESGIKCAFNNHPFGISVLLPVILD